MTAYPRISNWLGEPIIRFLLLGCVLLLLDRALAPANLMRDPTGTRIVVSAVQQQALAEAFRKEHGRAPSHEELQARLEHWIDEQVLYRQALLLGLDRRDAIVQRQLTQKMRFLLEDATVVPEPTREALQVWLEANPTRYGRAGTVDLEQVFLSRARHGSELAIEAALIGKQLARSPEAFKDLGDAFIAGQQLKAADEARLRKEFGADFATAVWKLPQRQWSGPVASAFGLHWVRITGRETFQPASLDEVIDRVRVDFRQAERERRNEAAMEKLRALYRIEFEANGMRGQPE